MTRKTISDAVGSISSKHIEEAADYEVKKKMSTWVKWGAVAACLCLLAAVAAAIPIINHINQPDDVEYINPSPTVTEDGVTIPQMKITLSADGQADMLAFFIYQGNCYTQYEWIYDNDDLVGEYLGTATGLIDEWTPADGYVELAGSISGDFYSVNGYDPSFMLCMKESAGEVSTYVCNTGITLKYGSELFEDRLHLSENYRAISYETRDSWYYSKNEIYKFNDSNQPIISAFIEQLNNAEFLLWNTVPENEGYTMSSIYDTEIYHVCFEMANGMTVHLRLYDNGYVRFQGVLDVCVQVPQDTFNSLISLLDSHEGAAPITE